MDTTTAAAAGLEELLAHEGWLRRLIVELVDEHHVEDVLQETWAAALARGPARLVSPRAWLRRVARGQAMRRRRAEVRGRQRESAVARDEALPSTASLVERLHAHQQVAQAVADLEEPYRSVVLLRFFEDLAPREIARRLGQNGSTVRTRIERGLQMLRGRLEGADPRALAVAILAPRAGEAPPPATLPALTLQVAAGAIEMTARHKAVTAIAVVLLCAFGFFVVAGTQAGARRSEPPAPPRTADVPSTPEPARVADAARVQVESADAAPPAAAVLRGRVLDPSGRPVAGVPLRFVAEEFIARTFDAFGVTPWPGEFESEEFGTSDADGRFRVPWPREFGAVYAGGDWVTVRAFTPPKSDWEHDEALLVAAPAMTVTGVVVNESGTVLAGVRVLAQVEGLVDFPEPLDRTSMTGLPQTDTDARGRFELAGVPRLNELRLTFAREGYRSATRRDLVGDGELRVTMIETERSGYRVSGVVVDEGGGVVEGATVLLHRTLARTNRHGEFTVRAGSLPESARLRAGLPGYQVGEVRDITTAVRASKGRHLQDVVLRLGGPALEIRGQVLDPRDRPLPGLVVCVLDAQAIESWHTVEDFVAGRESEITNEGKTIMKVDARTDAEGQFELRGLSDRAYVLRLFDPATLAGTTVTATAGNQGLVVRVDLETRRTVHGTVTSRSGLPLAGLTVEWGLRTFQTERFGLFAPGGRTETDDRGRFTLEQLPVGDVELEVSGTDIIDLEIPLLDVPDGADLSLQTWARCRFRAELGDTEGTHVRVLDASGAALDLWRTAGRISHTGDQWSLRDGRTPVLEVSEAARTLVVLRDGAEIDRRVLALDPTRVEVVR